MSDFIPPYPKPREDWIKLIDALKYSLGDLPAFWPKKAFEMKFPGTTLANYGGFIANCPDVIEHIFFTHSDHYKKYTFIEKKLLAPLLGEDLLDIEQSVQTLNAVANYSQAIEQVITDYQERWTHFSPQEKIAILPELKQLTAEIVCRLFFGHALDSAQTSALINGFADYQSWLEGLHMTSLVNLTSWLPLRIGKNQSPKAANTIHQVLDTLIAEELKNEQANSLLHYLVNNTTPGAVTPQKLRNQFILLFLIGHSMATNLLAWAWYLISQSSEVENRLHQELDNILINDKVSVADVPKLVYTQAILEETLRLYPTVPILSLETQKADQIRNKEIPVGASILVIPGLLQRHKHYWDRPDHFIPERFLAGEQTPPHQALCLLPFSHHPFATLLKAFGLQEATLCLAGLAKKFRLSVPHDYHVNFESGLIIRPKDNLPMLITPR